MTTKKPLATRLAPFAVVTLSALTFTACGGSTVSNSTATTTTTASAGASDTSSAAAGASDTGSASTSAGDTSSASGSGSTACANGKLVGGGSTAQGLAMQTITSNYKTQCAGADVEYTGTGSGAGIKDFYNNQIDWAGSDSPLSTTKNADGVIETDKAKARCGSQAWDLPMVVGPIAYAYNVKGVDNLVLTPKVIAEIFMGKITTWDNAEIKALNSGVTLPSEKINVFFRSDDSGTSDNVSKYMKAASSGVWTADHSKTWKGTAGEGKKGSQGVADGVKGTEGGFGYMEWKYATDSQLGVAQIDNGAGAVTLNADSVSKAAAAATVNGTGNDMPLSIKYTGTPAGAYPSILVTYEIVCSQYSDATKGSNLKSFLSYMSSSAVQQSLTDEGYAPLPDSLLTKVQAAVAAIK